MRRGVLLWARGRHKIRRRAPGRTPQKVRTNGLRPVRHWRWLGRRALRPDRRGHGARVGIAEDRFWGGTCVNVGCVPKKLLVQAGEYGAWADDAAGFGWTIKKGPHDWRKLIAAKDKEIGRLNAIYRKLLDSAGATIFDARAVFVDPHTLDVGGKRVTAEHIVIATGGHPERVPIPGAELGIISDDAFFLPKMPERVAIIGSGYIAVEFAGIFQALGAETHLIYRQPLPLRGSTSICGKAWPRRWAPRVWRCIPAAARSSWRPTATGAC